MTENASYVNTSILTDAEYCLLARAEVKARQRNLEYLYEQVEREHQRIGECLHILLVHGGLGATTAGE